MVRFPRHATQDNNLSLSESFKENSR